MAALGALRLAHRQMYHLRDQPNLLGAVPGWLLVAVSTVHLSARKSARGLLINFLQEYWLSNL
jgi:hypothetical protein